MRASLVTTVLLAACAPSLSDSEAPREYSPSALSEAPPPAALSIETTEGFVGSVDVVVTGDLSVGDTVYLIDGADIGSGPCFADLGGACLDLVSPKLRSSAVVGEEGTVTLSLEAPLAGERALQAALIKDLDSALSAPQLLNVVIPVLGCTDEASSSFDPAANVDDGSCEYAVYADIAGTWTGTVRETFDSSGAERSVYAVHLDLPEHIDMGVEILIADYTDIGCTGSWSRTEEAGDTFGFIENSYDGCLSDLPIRLVYDRLADEVVYRIENALLGYTGTGILRRG